MNIEILNVHYSGKENDIFTEKSHAKSSRARAFWLSSVLIDQLFTPPIVNSD